MFDPPNQEKTGLAAAKAAPAGARLEAIVASGEAAEIKDKTAWQASTEIKGIIESLTGSNKELSITLDQDTHTIIVKVLDSRTGEVIRRMPMRDPPVSLGEDLRELRGLLLDAIE